MTQENQALQLPTGLIPLGPQGQLLDPLTFLIFLLILPIRIVIEGIGRILVPPALPGPQTQALVPRVPFPYLAPAKQPLTRSSVIEAPSYTDLPTSTYENEERCEIVWNEDGLPTEIIIHRRATRT